MRNHRPKYEVYEGYGPSYWVLRTIDGKAELIERFESRDQAEDFMAMMNHIASAPRRLASH